MSDFLIGLISGTSVDGIDACLIEQTGDSTALRHTLDYQYPASLRQRLLELPRKTTLTLSEFGHLDNAVGEAFASAATQLLEQAGMRASEITAIGSHGQTLWHEPESAISIQIGNPSLIAAHTGITTVADFRRKDLALGGQGAPLVPPFHRAVFGGCAEFQAVLNIGGIANLSLLQSDRTTAFDTGPGNALMDEWVHQHQQTRFDHDGRWAGSGAVDQTLLEALLQEPYFRAPHPKSTGREIFNLDWVQSRFPDLGRIPAENVQRSLLELTALTITKALTGALPQCQHLHVCGGGAHNALLMRRLSETANCRVATTDASGFPGDWIEAATFAWLAGRTLNRQIGNIAESTGATRDAVLGGIYYP